jgi:hypothetical protein
VRDLAAPTPAPHASRLGGVALRKFRSSIPAASDASPSSFDPLRFVVVAGRREPEKEELTMAQATIKNQQTIIANQRTIIGNQKTILRNQQRLTQLLAKQVKIIRNQEAILKNQKRILALRGGRAK